MVLYCTDESKNACLKPFLLLCKISSPYAIWNSTVTDGKENVHNVLSSVCLSWFTRYRGRLCGCMSRHQLWHWFFILHAMCCKSLGYIACHVHCDIGACALGHGHFYYVSLWSSCPQSSIVARMYILPFVAGSLVGSASCTRGCKTKVHHHFPHELRSACIGWFVMARIYPSRPFSIQSSSPTSLDHWRENLFDNAMEM